MKKSKSPILLVLRDTITHHLRVFLLLLFAIAGAVTAGILPPLVLERFINEMTGERTVSLGLTLLYFAAIAASGAFDSAKESLITLFGQKITHQLRSAMCRKLSRLSADYFVKNEPGVTTSRFVNDVDTVEALFASGIISMVVDACKVVSIIGVIFIKSLGLGVLMLVAAPILYVITRVFQKKMLAAQLENRVAVGKANNHVPETISNIRMIHTFRKEKYMEKRYGKYINESYDAMEKSIFYDAVYSPVVIFIRGVMVAVTMVLAARGGRMQEFFGMTVGTAVAVISYVGKVFEPLESIGMEVQNIQSAVAGVKRISEFLTLPERETQAGELPEIKKEEAAVSFEHVNFGYKKEKNVLQNFCFQVKQGEKVTLAGRTGAGKSTAFKLILGLYAPCEGNVRIFGGEAKKIPDETKRKIFGYVEQSFSMIPGTVAEQITLKDPSITKEDVRCAAELVGLHSRIETLEKGYDTICTPALFSQGQFQLLSIARAVVADPRILLLDEITANLDSVTEETVLQALQAASKNRTVISISHRLYEKSGGRIIWIDQERGY